MAQVIITIKKKPGEDIVRNMEFNTQEDIVKDFPTLMEFLKYYTFI